MAMPPDRNEASGPVVSVEYRGRLAIITLVNEKKLNALSGADYFDLARKMREVAARKEVIITLLIGKGRFFSAGADVFSVPSGPGSPAPPSSPSSPSPLPPNSLTPPASQDAAYKFWLQNFLAPNLNLAHAFYTHPKILVFALNGPAVGLSAALVGFADFVYAAPPAYLFTPFSSLGLVAEGGASRGLVRRLGPARAAEALIMSRPIPASELLACGFVNKIIDPAVDSGAGSGSGSGSGSRPGLSPSSGGGDTNDRFKALVLREIDDRLGDHLVGESMLQIKALINRPERALMDAQNVAEVFGGMDRFMTGVPQAEFLKVATRRKKHKL